MPQYVQYRHINPLIFVIALLLHNYKSYFLSLYSGGSWCHFLLTSLSVCSLLSCSPLEAALWCIFSTYGFHFFPFPPVLLVEQNSFVVELFKMVLRSDDILQNVSAPPPKHCWFWGLIGSQFCVKFTVGSHSDVGAIGAVAGCWLVIRGSPLLQTEPLGLTLFYIKTLAFLFCLTHRILQY